MYWKKSVQGSSDLEGYSRDQLLSPVETNARTPKFDLTTDQNKLKAIDFEQSVLGSRDLEGTPETNFWAMQSPILGLKNLTCQKVTSMGPLRVTTDQNKQNAIKIQEICRRF